MERNKSQNKEIELLLEALENSDNNLEETQSLHHDADVVEFINAFNIFPGPNLITITSLFIYYKTWSSLPVPLIKFSMVISRLFDVKEKRGIKKVPIKNNLLELNNEIIKTKKSKQYLKKAYSYKKHVEKFIEELKIEGTDEWVELQTIYKWYIKWRYERKKIKLRPFELKRILSFYFQNKIGKKRAFFKLKGEFNMEKINQLRGDKNEKKQQKGESETCCPKPPTKLKNQI